MRESRTKNQEARNKTVNTEHETQNTKLNVMKQENFSVAKRFKSFYYASVGVASFFKREHNAWLHLIAAVAVALLAIWVGVSAMEAVALLFSIGFVWLSEMFNTCIEKMMDFISEERNPKIEFIKDVSAGAVLVASVVALIVGLVIFIPKFMQ